METVTQVQRQYNFNKPAWDKRPYADRVEYQNLNQTGSRLFDLLIHASGSYNGTHALWIGFKERNDTILAEEVQQLIENGESVLQILESEPYFLGCFPSRIYPSAKFTPITYCMSQRMPFIAEKIVDLCTKEELELLAPLPMAVKCYSRYVGQKNEYKNLIKKMVHVPSTGHTNFNTTNIIS